MNTTTNTTARRAATTVVLAGAGVLVAAPAFAGVPPEDTGSGSSQSTAQAGTTGGLSPQTRSKVEQMEQEIQAPRSAPQPAGSPSNPSDPSSVPVTVLALLGGTLIAGAAGFTVYRFRHHGPMGAATA